MPISWALKGRNGLKENWPAKHLLLSGMLLLALIPFHFCPLFSRVYRGASVDERLGKNLP